MDISTLFSHWISDRDIFFYLRLYCFACRRIAMTSSVAARSGFLQFREPACSGQQVCGGQTSRISRISLKRCIPKELSRCVFVFSISLACITLLTKLLITLLVNWNPRVLSLYKIIWQNYYTNFSVMFNLYAPCSLCATHSWLCNLIASLIIYVT